MTYFDIEKHLTMNELKSYNKIFVEGWEAESKSDEPIEVETTYEINPTKNTAHEIHKTASGEDMDWEINEQTISLSRALEYINSFVDHAYTANSRYFVTGEKSLKGYKTAPNHKKQNKSFPKLNFRGMI